MIVVDGSIKRILRYLSASTHADIIKATISLSCSIKPDDSSPTGAGDIYATLASFKLGTIVWARSGRSPRVDAGSDVDAGTGLDGGPMVAGGRKADGGSKANGVWKRRWF